MLVMAVGLFQPAVVTQAFSAEDTRPVYRSPFDVAFSPKGRLVAVSDHTGASAVILDATLGQVVHQVPLRGKPAGVVWSADGSSVYVAETTAGTVAEIDLAGNVVRRLKVGPWPMGLALAPRRGWLVAANYATGSVSLVELATGEEIARIPVARTPFFVAITPDENTALVGNRLPAADAMSGSASARISFVSLSQRNRPLDIQLPANSRNVHGVAISPDGAWAYVVHSLSDAFLPTVQIESGWINANALSIMDLRRMRRYVTILLDRLDEGAADPWDVAVTEDGRWLWVTLAGVDQIGRLDLDQIHKQLAEKDSGSAYARMGKDGVSISVRPAIPDLPLPWGQGRYVGHLVKRIDVPGGPRGLAISASGEQLAVGCYFSGTVSLVNTASAEVTMSVSIGQQPKADEARRGERLFHDARLAHQHWLSCATCHPDGRMDGLNWDLLNDGIGNAKNTRSLVLSHFTPPVMARGVRSRMEAAVAAGFRSILFQEPHPADLRAVEWYLRSLRPAASPYLVDGKPTRRALQGKSIFERGDTGCAVCHPAPLLTDLKMHDVGTRVSVDQSDRFDTPTLIEVWRTAPYLHHGRAVTLHEVLGRFNEHDKHGKTSHLTRDEIDALVEYLLSL
jgi:DNA-binding beta-propeller fold protein YncE